MDANQFEGASGDDRNQSCSIEKLKHQKTLPWEEGVGYLLLPFVFAFPPHVHLDFLLLFMYDFTQFVKDA
jgi:hypothetical protein